MVSLQSRLAAVLLAVIGCSFSAVMAFASNRETERIIHDAMQPDLTQLQQVNEFIGHSKTIGKPAEKLVQISNAQIFAKLITPLNSSFNQSGDEVQAVVVGSKSQNGKPWLDEGTILTGVVESSKKATYGQTDGTLVIRFYVASVGDKQIELFTGSDTDDGAIKPSEKKPMTKKQRIRGVLMTVTKIAIPAAIGTGGMSVAITAGAGAAIGFAFADKNKHMKGAVRGAWEGAGLNLLDPIVCKGRSVVLPQGTPIGLLLTESVSVPKYIGNQNLLSTLASLKMSGTITDTDTDAAITQMSTHAQILQAPRQLTEAEQNAARELSEQILAPVNKKISQNDLAAALVELSRVEKLYPNDSAVKQMHAELYGMLSGQPHSVN